MSKYKRKDSDPTYISWRGMRERCNTKSCKDYPRYGGRGIQVCTQWDDYYQFLKDMGFRPPGTSLDRIDTNKGYSPDNCKWSTPAEQACNRRRHSPPALLISPQGDEIIIASGLLNTFCREVGLDKGNMRKVLSTNQRHHKQWRGKWLSS